MTVLILVKFRWCRAWLKTKNRFSPLYSIIPRSDWLNADSQAFQTQLLLRPRAVLVEILASLSGYSFLNRLISAPPFG